MNDETKSDHFCRRRAVKIPLSLGKGVDVLMLVILMGAIEQTEKEVIED